MTRSYLRYTAAYVKPTSLLLGLIICGASLPAMAQGQVPQPAPQVARPATPGNPMRQEFRQGLAEWQGQLDQMTKDVKALNEKLERQSSVTFEAQKLEMEGLREKLTYLGTQIQSDAPLLQRLDRLEQWLGAQRARVENKRAPLGVEFTEALVKSYKSMLQEAATAREELGSGAKSIDALLTELSRSEDRIAELIMAEDASAAIKELRQVVAAIRKTIEGIQTGIKKQFNPAGA